MSTPLEDYALLTDMQTGPLVSRRGSVDWLCVPRFDGPSVFAALLGGPDQGRWLLAPAATVDDRGHELPEEQWTDGCRVGDHFYAESTFVLQTVWITDTGSVRVTDFMPLSPQLDLARRVEGLTGEVAMHLDLRMRFDYGRTVPWVSQFAGAEDPDTGEAGEDELIALAGPDAMVLRAPVRPEPVEDETGPRHEARFTVAAGQTRDFVLTHFESFRSPPPPIDVGDELREVIETWREWDAQGRARPSAAKQAGPSGQGGPTGQDGSPDDEDGAWAAQCDGAVRRSLLVVRGLMHQRTGALVGAPTTSLPERLGGDRNWDARCAWLRDSAQALEVMLDHGHDREALQLRNWLLRSVAGAPTAVQSVYGPGSERHGGELALDLPGYEGSRPVRVGNGAVGAHPTDAAGHLLTAFEKLRRRGMDEDQLSWSVQRALLCCVAQRLQEPDQGVWEMRGDRRFHTQSRVLMWAALQAGVDAVALHGLEGDLQLWESQRDQLALEIWSSGYDAEAGTFVQGYGSREVDASLLQLPMLGFVDWEDERMVRTARRIARELGDGRGMISRYRNVVLPEGADPEDALGVIGQDGFAGQDVPHLAATLWLAVHQARGGRPEEARATVEAVLRRGTDLGLLGTCYAGDPDAGGRMLGNVPSALTHLALIRAVDALEDVEGRGPGPSQSQEARPDARGGVRAEGEDGAGRR